MVDLRWPLAIAATAVAGVVVFVAVGNRPSTDPVTLRDGRDDVFGPAPAALARAADLATATIDREDGEYRLRLTLQEPLEREALADEVATYDVRMESARAGYVVRVQVSSRRAAATSVDSRQRKRPFVLPEPVVRGGAVTVRVPEDAVERLPSSFTWGVTASVGGSSDRLPSDLAAKYPA